MLAMFLTVLYKVEGLETETLKWDLMQQWSDSSESVAVDCFMDVIIRSNNNPVNDMTALMSGLINDLDKVMKIKSCQSMFG